MIVLLFLLAAPSIVRAAPALGLSWNSCGSIEPTHPVVGTDRIAQLVVFVEGLATPVFGFELELRIKSSPSYACACSGADLTTVTPAWQFEPGGCQGPDRVAARFAPAVAGCVAPAGHAGFESFTTERDSSFCTPSSCGTSNEVLRMVAARTHGWQLDPQARTGLWSVQFDLGSSCAFASGPVPCCDDDQPMDLVVRGVAYDLDGAPIDLGVAIVTYAAGAVPTRNTSWGKLKVQYR